MGEEAAAGAASGSRFPGDDGVALATMDIFAGCGGLSEGMHQAGEPSWELGSCTGTGQLHRNWAAYQSMAEAGQMCRRVCSAASCEHCLTCSPT